VFVEKFIEIESLLIELECSVRGWLLYAELVLLGKIYTECRSPFSMGLGSMRFFSEDVTHLPNIKDPELYNVFKDLLAVNWSELPDSVVSDVKKVLSRNTDDKAGKEVVENVFRAAQAVEEFGGILVSLKLEIDDSIGVSGEVFLV